jgi:hypothetical protein
MHDRTIASATAVDRSTGSRDRGVFARSRPLSAAQEGIFFAVVFAVALCVQLVAVILQ